MRDAQRPDHISLTSLIHRLRDGRFVIPDFQREFEWKPSDINALMRSIFLDYYIGSLLLWKGKDDTFDALACQPIYGYPKGNGASPEHVVLDGQQRLTAMYYTFFAPDENLPSRANRYHYFIRVDRFMDGEHDEAFDYDWRRWFRGLLLDDLKQWESHTFPLSVIGASGFALANWLQGYARYWADEATAARASGDQARALEAAHHADNARAFGEHMQGITERYQISYIELDRDLELDKVCDIFTQINSRGIRLDTFDLMNALLKPKHLQLKHMWHEAAPRLSFVETERMNVYVLQVMSILRQTYCSPKYLYYLLPGQQKKVRDPDGRLRVEQLVADIGAFKDLWQEAVDALTHVMDLLRHPQEFGAIAPKYLPYVSILPAFAALHSAASAMPADRQLEAHRKVRHWYWASVFTNRYSGSVESTTARDYVDVRGWIEDDAAEPGVIEAFKTGFKSHDLSKETKRGTSIYNGIFNLLVLHGARDWATGAVPQYGDLNDFHIVPPDLVEGSGAHTIVNRTPLSTATYRGVVRNRLPNRYLRDLIQANGEDHVRTTLETHLVSATAFDILLRDPFTPQDYDQFLAERQRSILMAIEDQLVKQRLTLSPQLRELDEQIERIELRLRQLIVDVLAGQLERLPSSLHETWTDRREVAIRRNPGLDDTAGSLTDLIDHANLGELKDVIVSKPLWPSFSDLFGGKPLLEHRFFQLGELRNTIRHSRTPTEVTQKDGEAAIGWFSGVLDRATSSSSR